MSDEVARTLRAAARAAWTGEVLRLGDAADLSVASAPAELLVGLVRELTLTAWALRGTPLPTYRREDMPGRVLRRSTEPTP